MFDRINNELRRGIGFALVALMAFGAMAGGAAAHTETDEHGTLTFHDSRDGEPETADGAFEQGQLGCEFWIRGYNMSHPNGTIVAHHQLGGPTAHTHEVANWTGTENASGGWDFEVGPITLHDSGQWRIQSTAGETRAHETESHTFDYAECPDDHEEPAEDQPPACPENLKAQAQQNENIRLDWEASANASAYHVYRAQADGEMTHVAEVNDTSYTDTETEAETTYTYEVTAANGAGEAEDCHTVEVTAIPFFGNPALVAMAALGSVGAVGALRVRRG